LKIENLKNFVVRKDVLAYNDLECVYDDGFEQKKIQSHLGV